MLTNALLAGIGLVALWALIRSLQNEAAMDRLWIHWISQHRALEERVSNIEGRLAGLGPKVTLPPESRVKVDHSSAPHRIALGEEA